MATYVERDVGDTSAGIWAVVAVLIVLFALLFFGSNLFGQRGSGGNNTNIQIPTPNNTGTDGPTYTPPAQ